MKILFLEPFYGGSHRNFADGFISASRHKVELLTLPDRFWKWRMRGASLAFLKKISSLKDVDAIFATDLMDLADFKALAGPDCPPILLYFHENQLSYPLAPGEKRDFHLGFTNIISALTADNVVFNSETQLTAFISEAKKAIKMMPDTRHGWAVDQILEKTSVLHPGCRFEPGLKIVPGVPDDAPLILWNHRWEFDKQPDIFFKALEEVKNRNINFSLAVLGEKTQQYPDVFDQAREKFKDRIRVFGYAASGTDYRAWLSKAVVTVSCAIQENFGISVVEAVRHGCFPLLPNRLSYPEIMPDRFHDQVLYDSNEMLADRLCEVLAEPHQYAGVRKELAAAMEAFSWQRMVRRYDDLLESMC